jgi:hypothetical protein
MDSKPQQPEVERSGRGDVDPDGRRITREADRRKREGGRTGKIPPENRPGHRPDREQDKPHPAP